MIEQGGCFSPDARIATDKGLIPAAELADRMDAGETFHAQTHKGLRQVTARFRNGVKPLYELTTERGYRVKITEDHKVAVLMDGQITTMALKYLQPGDEMLLLLGEATDGEEVPLKEVDYQRSIMSTTLNTEVTFPSTLNTDLAYWLGYAHGDGYVHIGKKVNWTAPKAIKLATSDDYPMIRQRLVEITEQLFGITPKIEQGDGAVKNIGIYSRMLMEWLIQNQMLKAHSEDVRVPEVIFRSPAAVQCAFIAGYFDADGCDRGRKGGYGFDSVSSGMVEDIQQLLAANGIVSSINATDRSAQGWRTIYRLSVTGASFKKRFAALVDAEKVTEHTTEKRDMYVTYPSTVWWKLGARSKYRQRIYDGVSERISYGQLTAIRERLFADGQLETAQQIDALQRVMPDTILSIEPVGESEVFDFEVDDVHLLSGNGIYTSNSRRGALMLILNDWHPDIFDFINSKREAGKITNANISVGISDTFMEAVKADADWDLMFPDTSDAAYDSLWDGDLEKWIAAGRKVIRYKTVKAREVWQAIIESAWASAEPGIWFRERSNKMSNSWYFNSLIATNPCGEQSLGGFSVCNLGALNLAKFYDPITDDVAWDDLRQGVSYAVRFLDNVIDSTMYFFEENRQVQTSERRVGLGTMGIAELLVKLKIRYGSPESVEFIDNLYHEIARVAYVTSSEIAAQKGAFPQFDAEKFLQSGFMLGMDEDVRQHIAQHGIRNVTLLTQAPTGTTGTLVNTSTGIEPFFSWVYYRKSRLGLHEEKVPLAQEYYDQHPDETQLPDYFITAMELAPEEHVNVQAAFQRWVDSSISKTCNVPNDYTIEQVAELYQQMYDMGCKGGTIYRDGSRDEQVLMLKTDEKPKEKEKSQEAPKSKSTEVIEQVTTPHRVYPRPKQLRGVTIKAQTPFGTAYITMNADEHGNPFEVFITSPGKAGSDLQADAEGLGRMISLSLRTTAPQNRREMLKLIVEQLQGIGGTRSVGFGPARVISLPDAVAHAIEEYFFPKVDAQQLELLPMALTQPMPATPSTPVQTPLSPTNGHTHGVLAGADMCPSCGTISFVRVEGCKKCMTCEYSEC
ncbi:MAG: adenosylcobalamin-dependent ribonucleoside-diphosphate reductase [Phototrophicaceae bacterium]